MKKTNVKTPPEGGDCYDANGREFLDKCRSNKNDRVSYQLVHGIATNSLDGKPMCHAWIEQTLELGNERHTVVLDVANNRVNRLTLASYYAIGSIKGVIKYDYDEACKLMVESGHWGSWDSSLNNIR